MSINFIQVSDSSEDDYSVWLWECGNKIFEDNDIHLHSNYSDYFIALIDNEITGATSICVYENYNGPNDIEATFEFALAVKPEFKRKGIGKAMVERVLSHARTMARQFSYNSVYVECYIVNTEAMVPMVSNLGFAEEVEPGRWRLRVL